jgi:TRAP transporter TAXI family solute receptor
MLLSAARPAYARNRYTREVAVAIGAGSGTACRCAKPIRRAGLALAALLLACPPAAAQSGKSNQPQVLTQASVGAAQALRAKLNQETLVITAGRPGTSYMAIAADLAAAVGASSSVRLLPVATDGGVSNLQDLLLLRGVDLAIVPANVLAHARTANGFGGALPQRIAYVTALYSEGVHVIAGRDIAAVGDLRDKKVAVPAGDGTVQFTASDVFKHLAIAVESVPMDPAEALRQVRDGRIAAVLLLGGKPLAQVSALPKDGSLHLLSLPFQSLPGEGYVPAVFVDEDYPALIPPGAIVETVGVGAVLMASKSGEEARRIAKHTPALLTAIGTLAASDRHLRWRDVNLGAVLPGWFRNDAAEKWLSEAFAQRKQQLKGIPEPPRAVKTAKSTALTAPKERKKLFDEFEAWSSQSAAEASPE